MRYYACTPARMDARLQYSACPAERKRKEEARRKRKEAQVKDGRGGSREGRAKSPKVRVKSQESKKGNEAPKGRRAQKPGEAVGTSEQRIQRSLHPRPLNHACLGICSMITTMLTFTTVRVQGTVHYSACPGNLVHYSACPGNLSREPFANPRGARANSRGRQKPHAVHLGPGTVAR
jgi:hypothetical protein